MGRRGRRRRLGVEDEYWQLILSGVGTVEACKLVGIGRKTLRMASGASGLRSKVSSWLGPPCRNSRMAAFSEGTKYASFAAAGFLAVGLLATLSLGSGRPRDEERIEVEAAEPA